MCRGRWALWVVVFLLLGGGFTAWAGDDLGVFEWQFFDADGNPFCDCVIFQVSQVSGGFFALHGFYDLARACPRDFPFTYPAYGTAGPDTNGFIMGLSAATGPGTLIVTRVFLDPATLAGPEVDPTNNPTGAILRPGCQSLQGPNKRALHSGID